MQHATIHLREARSAEELLPSTEEDPVNTFDPPFYSLTPQELKSLEDDLDAESLKCKKDWFTYNGGASTSTVDHNTFKKPLFFDIALNYVELNMERLQERAGKTVAHLPASVAAPVPQRSTSETILRDTEKAKTVVSRAKAVIVAIQHKTVFSGLAGCC